ncbi:MAG: peptidoglycan editing factor PgeF [Alphaproteobacteria bacterium]|nr:peptidoglycan editing factor PgeF [Alphaproteobacteria bacterium]
MIRSELLSSAPRVAHGFFTRQGGVSTGIYASLNCGVGSDDSRDNVRRNRARVLQQIGAPTGTLNTVHQVHGTVVAEATGAWPAEPPVADGVVSCTPGVVIGILTADCAPVLFADRDAGVIGGAHCGWRGALDGVAEQVVERMVAMGAQTSRIVAAVGPAIAQASYEVSADFEATFIAKDPHATAFFAPGKLGHAQFDLPGYVVDRLRRAGLMSVAWTGHDTYVGEAGFFSYRRATHRHEPDYGRQVSAIALVT